MVMTTYPETCFLIDHYRNRPWVPVGIDATGCRDAGAAPEVSRTRLDTDGTQAASAGSLRRLSKGYFNRSMKMDPNAGINNPANTMNARS